MKEARVLVVDDSAAVRQMIRAVLLEDADIREVITRPCGEEALSRLGFGDIDIIVLDIEMPGMDGLEVLRRIQAQRMNVPVIVFSSATREGADVTVQALALGAVDFVTKPAGTSSFGDARDYVRTRLIGSIRAVLGRKPAAASSERVRPQSPARGAERIAAVVIAASMGGPHALGRLLGGLPREMEVPVFIVQHMPPLFLRVFAQRLADSVHPAVRECGSEEEVPPGSIWLAAGGRHMEVVRRGQKARVRMVEGDPVNFCRPAADILFASAARVYGSGVLGVVMTGMGQDGLEGTRQILSVGGEVIVQDQDSSVVWGMAGSIVRNGLASAIIPLEELGSEIVQRVRVSARADAGLPGRQYRRRED